MLDIILQGPINNPLYLLLSAGLGTALILLLIARQRQQQRDAANRIRLAREAVTGTTDVQACYNNFLRNINELADNLYFGADSEMALNGATNAFREMQDVAPEEVVAAANDLLDTVDPFSETSSFFYEHIEEYRKACETSAGIKLLPLSAARPRDMGLFAELRGRH